MMEAYAKWILEYVGPTHDAKGIESANAYHHRHAGRRMYTTPHGRAIRALCEGFARYADAYADQCGQGIGDDGVLADPWATIGYALCKLLDGETGGWDCGSLNHQLREVLAAEGFDPEAYSPERRE